VASSLRAPRVNMDPVMSPAAQAPTSLRVAAVQLNSRADLFANLQSCGRLVAQAADRGASLVVLPENFAYLGAEGGRRELAERVGDTGAPIQQALSQLARDCALTLVAGGFPEVSQDPRRPFNTCVVFSPAGQVMASYRKLHLFDVELADGTVLRESAACTAGDAPVVVPVGPFHLGLSICYDLRFPELYRALVDRGADVLLVPAAFTRQTGRDHWHVLTRARAIESQSWLVAPNQWGSHPQGRTSYGHTVIIDPWGTVVAQCSDRVGILVADLDQALVSHVRNRLPSLRHRRL
jgi:predicted amidohydrolase